MRLQIFHMEKPSPSDTRERKSSSRPPESYQLSQLCQFLHSAPMGALSSVVAEFPAQPGSGGGTVAPLTTGGVLPYVGLVHRTPVNLSFSEGIGKKKGPRPRQLFIHFSR